MKRRFMIAAVAGLFAASLAAPAAAHHNPDHDIVNGPACTNILLDDVAFERVMTEPLPGTGLLSEPTDDVILSGSLLVEGGGQRCEGATYNFVVKADADSAPIVTTAVGTSCPGGGTTSCEPGGAVAFSVRITDADADEFCAAAESRDTLQHVAAYSTWKGSTADRAPDAGFIDNGPECAPGGFSAR